MKAIAVIAAFMVAISGTPSPAFAGGGGGGQVLLLGHSQDAWMNCWVDTGRVYQASGGKNIGNWFDLRIKQVSKGKKGSAAVFECQRVSRRSDVPFVFSYWGNGQYGNLYNGGRLTVVCQDSRQRVIVIHRDSGPNSLHVGCAG